MSVAELRRMLFGAAQGKIAVLTAYFDDSGTHAGSKVLLMGGLYGNDHQWLQLETAWRKLLADPGKGWAPLKRFHMYDCEHAEGEFAGYSRGARDHLIYRFRNIILEAKLHGYAMAICADDWAELVTGDRLAAWGDAERFAVTNCLLNTMDWAARESVETDVAFVLDDRPQRRDANQRVYSIYMRYGEMHPALPQPVGLAFLNSDKAVPLQAADMFAWEANRYSHEWLLKRRETKARPHFAHFLKTGRIVMQCGTREAIEAMLASVTPGSEQEAAVTNMAKYFSAPDLAAALAQFS